MEDAFTSGLAETVVMSAIVALSTLTAAALWRIFQKAGRSGWKSMVPIYNVVVMFDIAGKPMWWTLLLLVPLANLFVIASMLTGLARSFGKSEGFAFGLFFLSPIYYPILAFGDAQYCGPDDEQALAA